MLHNFIRKEMSFDDMEMEVDNEPPPSIDTDSEIINNIEPSN